MHHFWQGKPTRQGHKGIPEGQFEEEQGLKGFFGPVSHLIRQKPTTRWTNIEGPLKPRLFDLIKLTEASGIQRLFFNQHMTVSWQWVDVQKGPQVQAYRDADGDLLYFCHKGAGEIWTDYGLLPYKRGHYIVVPKSLVHAILPSEKSNFFVIEDRSGHFEEPTRGIVGRHAIYDINAIGKPNLEALHQRQKDSGLQVTSVSVKHLDQKTMFTYDACIFDVVGWKGDLFPFTLHVDDMMPLMSHRAHLPPSAHTTFLTRDFVVCTFLPRPLEHDDDALKVPFYHQNIDYDEILFYHDGDFFSRDNLHAGMLTFHPAGFPHGPHPKAIQKVKEKKFTDEYAVMVDSRWPLQRDPILDAVEVADYWKSWMK